MVRLRASSSQLYSQELLLTGSGEPYAMQGIEPGPAVCKANTLLPCYAIAPCHECMLHIGEYRHQSDPSFPLSLHGQSQEQTGGAATFRQATPCLRKTTPSTKNSILSSCGGLQVVRLSLFFPLLFPQDINSLNKKIAQLQDFVRAKGTQSGRHLQTHSNTIVVSLQVQAAGFGVDWGAQQQLLLWCSPSSPFLPVQTGLHVQ